MSAVHLSVSDSRAAPLVLAAMWMPALGRYVATHTVDRHWRSPFPAARWGNPPAAIVLVPVAIVLAIYGGSYAVAAIVGIARETPAWQGRILLNVMVNAPILAVIGGVGALGEELGWKGYLQPRLDQLGVRGSLLWVIFVEILYHLPLILFGEYLDGGSVVTIALFAALGLGLTPVSTWLTYRWRTIWIAVALHTFHNAVSQTLLPKSLGVVSDRVIGESGILPVALYLVAAAIVFGTLWQRGETWRAFAARTLQGQK
jgi:membrane protease YdiL (CAAX protease family)